MSGEHPPPPPDRDDAERAGTEDSDPAADAYIAYVRDHAPTPDVADRIADVYRRRGTPYAIYLGFEDTDPYADDAEAGFASCYIGRYQQRDDLIADTITAFGWDMYLDRYLAADPLLRAMVAFDSQAIWNFIGDHYDVIERSSGIYLFEQAP